MRQNFWPQFQVGCRFEDHHLRRLHKDRVYSVHEMASVRWKPARPAMLRNFRRTENSSPKSVLVKEKNRPPSIREQAVAGEMNLLIQSPKAGIRTLTFDLDALSWRVSLKNRVWQRRLLVPVGSYSRKTPAIGR
jgi:hypothetical protein